MVDIIGVGRVALESLLSIALAIPSFLGTLFSVIISVASWLVWLVMHFWIVFGLIEIGILGLAMQKYSFMEKTSELVALHKRIYLDVIYKMIIDLIRLAIRVISAIGNYIPFT